MSGTSGITKRACDACHRRKVRCNGSSPCQNCLQASLTCTYNKVPQKKGPKGSRAKVIAELRKSQEESPSSSKFRDDSTPASPLASPMFSRHPDPLPPDVVDACIDEFFDRMWTTVPVLDRGWIQQKASEITTSPESYCLVGALCVYMIVQSRVTAPSSSSSPLSPPAAKQRANLTGLRMVDDIKYMRTHTDYSDNPTTSTILTSFFLSAGLFSLERQNIAWYYMQEAITFIKMMRINSEEAYGPGEPTDIMNRRLFWILFITERAQALHKHRDILLHETIDFPRPDLDDPMDELAINGLTCLYNLFRVVDDRFSETWTNLRTQTQIIWPPNTALWLAGLQRQLSEAVPEGLKCTKIQEADLRVTQQWLRTIVWQLSTANGCLSSAAPDESMTLLYPITVSKDMVEILSYIDTQAMDVHGIGLVEKLFDIAYSLADVIALNPVETGTYEVGPRDYLTTFWHYVSTLRNGETKFVGLLQAKIREVLPALAVSLGFPPPPAPSSTHSRSSSNNPRPGILSPLTQVDSILSNPSSPFGSPTILAGAPQLTSNPLAFPLPGHAPTSAP